MLRIDSPLYSILVMKIPEGCATMSFARVFSPSAAFDLYTVVDRGAEWPLAENLIPRWDVHV